MPKKLDYRAVWMDARALLAVHKEAIAAIAGFFIFMSAWVSAFLMPPLIVENLDDRNQAILEISRYFEANWRVLVPTMLVTIYGSLSLYVLMSGRSLEKVGDALKIAAALFFPYLLASLLVGWATLAGFLMLIIPGLYLSGRFAILPAVITQDVGGGVRSSVIRSWRVTHNCGWSILFLMLFVAVILRIFAGVADAAIVAICQSIAGEGGVPIVVSAVKALFVAIEAVVFIVMLVAVNRQLSAQTPNQ
ncbi:hypothetical protein [Sphingorhabdus wooponensis]|jgi:hypothetical protein|uniref:Glycerophosphoryl diester phosphodiesterase membrane domain-containing protein n=1 Tax=Sphingorhabdus wooponensis TaxID=940136 RepID=A0A426RSH8_9SPHN|nr:hypothetical protein [Sphingorhabdus wooponensis]RRQ51866.1 hypothetical protein D7D48_03010 [Sphingorhabdus wooponensis]